MEEVQQRPLLTTSEIAQKELITDSILLAIVQAEHRRSKNTRNVIFPVCRETTVLLQALKMFSCRVMRARKCSIGDASFGAFVCSTNFATGLKSSNLLLLLKNIFEAFMAKSRSTQTVIKAEYQTEYRDLLNWKRPNTSDMFRKVLLSKFKLSDDRSKVNKLSKNGAARRAYLVFEKFDMQIYRIFLFLPSLGLIL